MKMFAKITSLFLMMFITLTTTATATVTTHSDEERSVEMRFLSRDHVKAGSAITAEVNATMDTQAQLIVENPAGKRFLETNLNMDQGANVVKFKVAEIPAGVYFVKLYSEGKTKTLSFVVQ
jgi:hypothetical protein